VLELLDEPDLNNSELVEKLLLALQVAKEAVPEMKIQIVVENRSYPMSAFETLAPYTDVWCLNDGRWNDAQLIAFMEEWQQGEGKELWFYACSTNLRENPYRYYRLHPWKAFARNLDGMGLYEYMDSPDGKYGARSWKIAPRGAVAYRNFDEPIPSVRFECFREGIDDIKYLAKLSSLIQLAREKGLNNGLIQEAEIYLNTEPQKVVAQSYNPAYADEVREQVANYIIQIQQLLK
jgi:hypothetical protein